MKKRYAFAGASYRAVRMYAVPLGHELSDVAELTGVYDPNLKRAEVLRQKSGQDFPLFDDFDKMLAEVKPDIVIVTTIDRYHHDFIIRSFEAGCDVICEKPMTIDDEKCEAILKKSKETGRTVTVAFNYRFAPFATRIREIIKSGAIGDVLSVHFEWMLDTSHGADYFRRWHRRKENSGGLLVHKSTHHFDLVNWILEDKPVSVHAFGSRRYYGDDRRPHGERCQSCAYTKECPQYYDLRENELWQELYLDCEDADGYHRDQCVFSGEIDIEDTLSVNVLYNRGALLSYSLTAHSPYEGHHMMINGTEGRLEAEDYYGDIGVFAGERIYKLRLYNRKNEEISYRIPPSPGLHGGGDIRLREMIFRGGVPDPLGHLADARQGALSIMTGIAGNRSIATGSTVRLADLAVRDYRNW